MAQLATGSARGLIHMGKGEGAIGAEKLLAGVKFRFILLELIVIFICSQVIHSYRSYYS